MALTPDSQSDLLRLVGDNSSESIPLSPLQLGPFPDGLWVLDGNDTVQGVADEQAILGNKGQDRVAGGAGNDSLRGGRDNDHLFGEDGNDTLSGDRGADSLTGGGGADVFIVQQNRDGSDVITDYQDGADKLLLNGSLNFNNLTISNNGGNTVIADKTTGQVLTVLQGINNSTIDASDFLVQGNPTLAFSAAEFSGVEDGTPIVAVTVTRIGSSVGEVSATVNLTNGTATAPQDYDNSQIVVNFADGQIKKAVAIPITDDSLPEGNESVSLSLSNPTGGAAIGSQNSAILTIVDDEVPGTLDFAAAEFSVLEVDIPILTVTVSRSGGSFGEVSATINLTDGTATASQDYINTPIAVNFADGELEKTVAIPILDDDLREGLETVNLTLANPTGGAAIGTQKTATLKIVDNEVSSIISSRPGTVVNPETVDVFLVPDDELTIPITVTVPGESAPEVTAASIFPKPSSASTSRTAAQVQQPSTQLPLDVFLLQDLSESFQDDIQTVRELIPNLVSSLTEEQSDTRFGVGSFVDKPVGDLGDVGDYVYRTDLPLTTDPAAPQSVIGDFTILSGDDGPEAQLEALLQTARHTTQIGFRDNTRRVVVVATDASFHEAGDGIVADITTPNNLDAILDGNPPGTGEDYPAIEDVRQALLRANIVPIFAVTSDQIDTYENLVSELGFGAVTELSTDSSNLIEAINQGLESVASQINVLPIQDNAGFIAGISQDKFTGLSPGESRTTEVTLRKPDGTPANDTVDIGIPGFGNPKINVTTGLEGPYASIPVQSNDPSYLQNLKFVKTVTGGDPRGQVLLDAVKERPSERKVGFKEINNPVNPNQTWVVTHGWNDSSDDQPDNQEELAKLQDKIRLGEIKPIDDSKAEDVKINRGDLHDIAEAIKKERPNDRVLLLDWREASNNTAPFSPGSFGESGGIGNWFAGSWISSVAEYAVKILRDEYGIDVQKALESLNLVGHSLGSLLSSEIGRIYKTGKNRRSEDVITPNNTGVRTITALDPASESNLFLVGGYDFDASNPGKDAFEGFAATSKFSRAFVGSGSFAGNQDFAATAQESFQIDFGNRLLRSVDVGDEHGWVVQTFTNLVDEPDKIGSLFGIKAYESIDDLPINNFGTLEIRDNRHEGILFVPDPQPTDAKSDNLSTLKPSFLISRAKDNQDNDIVIATSRNDEIDGADGINRGLGESRYTGSGDDKFVGESGNDKLVGDSGNDTLIGGSGDDVLEGDGSLNASGDDILIGGPGKDTLKGGSGADKFVFERGDGNSNKDQADFITPAFAGLASFEVGKDKTHIPQIFKQISFQRNSELPKPQMI
ncbi:Calx-beta domain-containing protein, partial [Microcoleus sp. F10-C6]